MSLAQPERQARIRPAETAEASALTDLALTSKAVSGYDAVFMAACRAELTVHPDSIRRDPTYLIEADGPSSASISCGRVTVAEVSMMFVAPEALRSGLGRRLWAHLEDTARRAGATRLEVDSDPTPKASIWRWACAYLGMGMRRRGYLGDGHAPRRRSALGQHPRPPPAVCGEGARSGRLSDARTGARP
jgi:GNAT superfamily N-acetyltransferase